VRQNLVIKHGRTPDDVARVGEFLEPIFGHWRDYLGSHPDVRAPECVRYIESDGEIVSAHVIERMELSFADGWIPAARVEWVATRESFRRQGLCRRLMEDSITWLKSEGTHVVVIFGEPLFRRLGFEYCIPSYEQTMPDYTPPGSHIIPTRALERFHERQAISPASETDLPDMARLHEADNPQGNLSRRRPAYYWQYLVHSKGIGTYSAVRTGGALSGYFRVQAGERAVHVREVVARDEEACSTIVAAVHQLAQAHAAETVVFHCPHSGTFGAYVRIHGAAAHWPHAQRETNLQMRVLDLAGCLKGLQSHLSRRLRRSDLCSLEGRYNIVTENSSVGLCLRDGEVTVIDEAEGGEDIALPDKIMAQLLSGFHVERPNHLSDSNAVHNRLIETMFPPGEPYWYVDDL